MLKEDEARDRAAAEVRSREGDLWAGDSLVLMDDDTLERDWGWVFFFDSRLWRETRNPRYRMSGNGPVVVNKFDGTVRAFGTAHPSEYYITAYETEFARDREGWSVVLTQLPPASPDALRALRTTLGLDAGEVSQLRGRIPAVVWTGTRPRAVWICEQLRTSGVGAESRRRSAPSSLARSGYRR